MARFSVGQRVKVARITHGITFTDLVGLVGEIVEYDGVQYGVLPNNKHHPRYFYEDEIEAVDDNDVAER